MIYKKLIIILLFLISMFHYVHAEECKISQKIIYECPTCRAHNEISVITEIEKDIELQEKGVFGDTWTCTNRNCRYENYVGINSCALCGKSRFR